MLLNFPFLGAQKTQKLTPIESEKSVGLIAGSGPFPFEFVRCAKDAGYKVVAVCIKGEASLALPKEVDSAIWIRLGELGTIVQSFTQWNVKQIALAGGISFTSYLKAFFSLDQMGKEFRRKLSNTHDDNIMRELANELGRHGIEVIACTAFMTESLASIGLITSRAVTDLETQDIELGRKAISAMAEFHIGQVVVVRQGRIVAVEGAEGTDRAIIRGGKVAKSGAVVVKMSKPGQDLRFDVPTIGPKTVASMKKAKVRVLAIEANKTLIVNKPEVIRLANLGGMTIVGI